MSFDWQTEEDSDWNEQEWRRKPVTAVPTKPEWRPILIIILLLIVGAGFIYQQIKTRVDDATTTIESDIFATHNLLSKAAINRDAQLGKSVLSGRDSGWSQIQSNLLTEGLFFEHVGLGMMLPEVTTAFDPLSREDDRFIELTLDSDLRGATLLYARDFLALADAGIQTVTLQQTAVYRQGASRWLYAPPLAEFWGEWVTNQGRRVTLVYPQRDAEVAERLAADLDELIGRMCWELEGINCPDNLRVQVRLEKDPESLLAANEIETLLQSGLRLNLPTPTLVGLPLDEPGYETLFRAYAIQMVTAVIADLTEYDCCRHQLFFHALRDAQLADLELLPWPLNEADYDALLANGFDGNPGSYWSRSWDQADVISHQVYALVDYLRQAAPETPVAEMQRLLVGDQTYPDWFTAVLQDEYENNLFSTNFLQFVFDQSSSGQIAEPPIPLPGGTLKFLCSDHSPTDGIYHYDLASQTWTEEYAHQGEVGQAISFNTSSDGQQILMAVYEFENNVTLSEWYLIVDGEAYLIDKLEAEQVEQGNWFYYHFGDAAGNYLVRSMSGEHTVIERECLSENCPKLILPGYVQWSPDGTKLLFAEPPAHVEASELNDRWRYLQSQIQVLDLQTQISRTVGIGGQPFWLGGQAVGFVRGDEEGFAVVTAVLANNESQIILDSQALLAEIPQSERPKTLALNHLVPHPQNGREFVLVTSGNPTYGPPLPNFFFRVILNEALTKVSSIELLRSEIDAGGLTRYSPDGRYLVFVQFGSNFVNNGWELWNLESGSRLFVESDAFEPIWSPDGQWLVLAQKNYLLLYAPAHDYQHFIAHGLEECSQILWLEE